MTRGGAGAASALVALVLVLPATAGAGPNLLTDPFQLSLGTFILDVDPSVRLDGETQTGTDVDWKRAFGLGDAARFRVDGAWRFSDRHKLRASWFSDSRDRTASFDREVAWGDETFAVDAEVRGSLDFDIYQLGYEYSFQQTSRYELTASAGLHVTDIRAALAASAAVDASAQGAFSSDIGKATAPLPVLGLAGLWSLPGNFWLNARGEYFYLALGDYEGRIQNYRVALTWQPRTWLGLGLSYDYSSLEIDIDRTAFTGKLDWTYRGPMLFYSASF
ncbi:hypothetical protein [Wenzhouxiangella limi]|uniref:Outer membrane protein beta-barrel domain-containing protein n=1 Tax=Wenzhouxiangella limi TaxID=2707351 RepID=A0A845VIG2_9GAMM|nr:hypothetical protein [Wenzhouxiangella limi]NDY96959.1 hypothetical protein [Wenzhouxiangella limi]